MNERVVIIGGGGHAKVIISILQEQNQYEVVGYTDVTNKGKLLGVEYLGTDDYLLHDHKTTDFSVIIGAGFHKNTQDRVRNQILNKFKKFEFHYPAIISNHSLVDRNVNIGKGTVVVGGCIINTGSTVGDFCLINTKSSIDHDCVIGENTQIGPGVTVCGEVRVGNGCFIGAGSTIINGVHICDKVVIGAGSTVLYNINEPGVYIGTPAKKKCPR